MKNKGFTLVELITTFALASVIIILLLNIIVLIKNIYVETNLKTELYINQSNLSNMLNKKIRDDNLLEIIQEKNEDNTIFEIKLKSGEDFFLKVYNNKIECGNYNYRFPSGVSIDIDKVEFSTKLYEESIPKKEIYILKVPIKANLYPDIDFGINLVYINSI